MGPLSSLTHTRCDDCGCTNCQEPEPTEFDEPDDDPDYLPTTNTQIP
jgi:hypothetical protein